MYLSRRIACALFPATLICLTPLSAFGAAGEHETRPLRLSFLEPTVSFWRSGAEDWVRARLNTPLAPGDHLYASSDGRFEIQIDSEAFIRASHGTELVIETVEFNFVQARVTRGRISVDAQSLEDGLAVEINAPGAAFTIDQPGYYRIEVGEETTDISILKQGRAEVVLSSGERWPVRSGEQAFVDPASATPVTIQRAAATDAWDEWNEQRRQSLLAAESPGYLPRGVYGGETLDAYGSWQEEVTYGRVWYPHTVAADWVPYSAGNWVWDPYFGWTWIDDSPWGWAPFHYGRWVHIGSRWAWAPGPIVTRPFYAPAVVGFYAGHHVGIGIGVGPIGWVALGWGEPIVPWWGGRGFLGAPCWRGWGGPRIVNNVIVHNTRVVHVDRIKYVHARERGALVSVTRDRFQHGRIDRSQHVSLDRIRLRPVRGRLPAPTTRALAPRAQEEDGHVPMPARSERPQTIVATRRPNDPKARLRASGLRPATKYMERTIVHVAPVVSQAAPPAAMRPEESRAERGVRRPSRPQESPYRNAMTPYDHLERSIPSLRQARSERQARGTSSEVSVAPGSRQAVGTVPYRGDRRGRMSQGSDLRHRIQREGASVPHPSGASLRDEHLPPPYPRDLDRGAVLARPRQPLTDTPDIEEPLSRSRLSRREEQSARPMKPPRLFEPRSETTSPAPMPRSFEDDHHAPRHEPRESRRPLRHEPAMRSAHESSRHTATRFLRSGSENLREPRGQHRARPNRATGKSAQGE